MRLVFVIIGGLSGLIVGAVVGFCVALFAMSFSQSRNDGSYGFVEVLICVPSGTVVGLLVGLFWGFTTRLGAG